MSEYQRIKARALELQREKEYELKRELARKAEQEKKAAKEEEERRKRIEEATKEARRIELMRANEALHKAATKPAGPADGYDPFAEDAFSGPSKPPPRATPKTTTRPNAAATGPRASRSGSGAGSKPRAGTSKAKPEPAALGRKEKAALKLQRAVKSTKGAAEDSLFSVRALVDGHDSRPGSGASSPRRPPASRPAPPSHVRGPASRLGGGGAGVKSSMAQLKRSVDVKELRALCPDRNVRDRRTVDEIQRDIRIRKGLPVATSSAPPSSGDRDRNRDRGSARPSAPPPSSSARRPGDRDRDRDRDRDIRDRDRDRDRDRGRDRDRDRGRDRDRDRRRRSPSSSDYESDRPPRRGRRDEVEEPSRSAVSAMIQEMFGRGRAPRRYDDMDSGSDMEAGLSDVELEERRALKIARREDEEAEREENARREAKERMKRMRKG